MSAVRSGRPTERHGQEATFSEKVNALINWKLSSIARGVDMMRISVLIEPVPGNGFRVERGEPVALEAEGATRDAALRKLAAAHR